MIDLPALADLCRSAPIALSPTDPVASAIAAMVVRGAEAVVLVSDDRPVGLYEARQLLERLALGTFDPATPLGELMSPHPPTLPARLPACDGLALLAGQGYRFLVLHDEQGRLAGLLEAADFVRALGAPGRCGSARRCGEGRAPPDAGTATGGDPDGEAPDRPAPSPQERTAALAQRVRELRLLYAESERALREGEEKYRTIVESVQDGIWLLDLQGGRFFANAAAARMLGYPHARALADIHPAALAAECQPDGTRSEDIWRKYDRIALVRGRHRFEWELRRADGSALPAQVSLTRVPYRGRHAIVALVRDLTAERAAQERQRLANTLFDNAGEGILIADAANRIVAVNAAFTAITGYNAEEVRGKNPRILSSGRQGPDFYRDLWEQLEVADSWSGEIWNRRKNGEIYPQWLSISRVRGPDGRVSHHLGVFSDRSAARRSAEEIRHLSQHDPLTGLPNLAQLRDRLEEALERARGLRQRLAVTVADLDRFQDVVASHGHAAGDLVLKAIAESLAEQAEPGDLVARLPGDSFAVARILSGDAGLAVDLAERIQSVCNRPLDRAGLPGLSVTASLGIALFPDDAASVTSLLRHAESALHRAKEAGRNGIACYRPEMTETARRRVQLETELRQALSRDELRLFYQPIADTRTGALVAVEALLRWQHPRAGLIGPQDLPGFIQAVELSDLVHPVGRWAIERAAEQARAWLAGGRGARVRVSVNVAGPQIAAGTLSSDVRRALAQSGLDPELLEIEVLEGVLLHDPAQALAELERVRDLGVAIALDDFGTGYSSLAYLKRFPVDYLKIDQSFIRHLASDPGDAAIVCSTIAMSHDLGIRTIAEGVETQGQMDCLARAGCDLVQGFLLGTPQSAQSIAKCLDEGRPLANPTAGLGAQGRKVLILEPDPDLGAWLAGELAGDGWDLLRVTTEGEAWESLAGRAASVLVCDHRPPACDAVAFLERARRLYPGATRILIAERPANPLLLAAVNRSGVFRVLVRPMSGQRVREAVCAAYRHLHGAGQRACTPPGGAGG